MSTLRIARYTGQRRDLPSSSSNEQFVLFLFRNISNQRWSRELEVERRGSGYFQRERNERRFGSYLIHIYAFAVIRVGHRRAEIISYQMPFSEKF